MRQVFLVYFMKHVDAVCAWSRGFNDDPEGIHSRLIDIAVYAKLGRLIAREG